MGLKSFMTTGEKDGFVDVANPAPQEEDCHLVTTLRHIVR